MARSVKRWALAALLGAALCAIGGQASATTIPANALFSSKTVICDGITTGTVRLGLIDVTGLPSFATEAWVISVSGWFDLVPNTGLPPDGSTLINANSTDSRQWKLVASGGGGPPTGAAGGSLAGTYPNPTLAATGITATTYGSGSTSAVCTFALDGRATGCVSTSISIAAAAISNSTSLGQSLMTAANAAAAQGALSLVPGTNVQAFHANLTAFAGLALVADRLPYANGTGTLGLATYTSAARTWDAATDATAETAILNTFGTSTKGLVPAPGSVAGNCLKDNGGWAACTGSSSINATTAETTAPATPSAGNLNTWADSTDHRLHDKNSSGTIGTTVVADTGATNNYLTAISAAGVISKARPVIGDITAFSSSSFFGQVTDESGSGAVIGGTSPTLTTPTINGATMGGALHIGDNPVDITVHSDGNKTGASPALADFSTTGNNHTWTLTGNVTGTPTWTIGGAKHFQVKVVQDATGSRTMAWPSTPTLNWVGGSAPTLSTAANAYDIIAFDYDGTTITGQASSSSGGSGITALTGDVTASGTGSVAATVANIPVAVTVAGKLIVSEAAVPFTPSAGTIAIYADAANHRFRDENSSGVFGTTVVASTAGANQFATSVGAAGVVGYTQPAFSNLSGSATAAQMPAFTGDVTTSAGSTATTIAANAVTNSKMATMAANTVKMNNTGGSATPTDVTVSTLLTAIAALPLAGGTMSGAIAMANNNVTGIKQATFNGTVSGGNKTGAAVALWDWTAGGIQTITLTGNVTGTSTCTAPTNTARVQSFIKQDATGGRTVASYCPNTHWIGPAPTPGSAPTLQTAANAVDVISCTYEATSTNYYCSMGSSN